eukprot:317433_1
MSEWRNCEHKASLIAKCGIPSLRHATSVSTPVMREHPSKSQQLSTPSDANRFGAWICDRTNFQETCENSLNYSSRSHKPNQIYEQPTAYTPSHQIRKLSQRCCIPFVSGL